MARVGYRQELRAPRVRAIGAFLFEKHLTMGKKQPYRWRTRIRRYLPWFLIDIGFANKGQDCEKAGGVHKWYNIDGKNSGCYHCKIARKGQLWKRYVIRPI